MSAVGVGPLARLGGILSIFVGAGGLLYGILFAYIVAGSPTWVVRAWLVLAMMGGLAATGVFVALYERLSPVDHAIALWAALLGVIAGLGQMLNASVGLGYALNPAPEGAYISEPDPLGILRFGLNGVALLIFAWVMLRSDLPRGLSFLAEIGGVLLVVMYIGRLTGIIDPAERITLIPPVVYGLLVHPVLYMWLGRELSQTRAQGSP